MLNSDDVSVSFVARYQVGSTSTSGTQIPEVILNAQEIFEGQHDWNVSSQFSVGYDASGNLSTNPAVDVGLNNTDPAPFFGFNTLVIMLRDTAPAPPHLMGSTITNAIFNNDLDIRDLYSDVHTGPDFVFIKLGEDAPVFEFSGEFNIGEAPHASTDAIVEVYGFNDMRTIPEPSVFLASLISLVFCVIRRRR
jgi:hypothetical protein